MSFYQSMNNLPMLFHFSSKTGIAISRKAAMVPLQMELGGKDVCIVCADADLDLAAKSIVKGGFSYSGQRCTAVKLVLADKKVGKCECLCMCVCVCM